jgi:hypothetical protein
VKVHEDSVRAGQAGPARIITAAKPIARTLNAGNGPALAAFPREMEERHD